MTCKGFNTASGSSSIDERRKLFEEQRDKEINDKKDFLKRFLPDWFIDELEYFGMTYFNPDKDEYVEIRSKNLEKRLNEAIGELVIFRVWVGHHGSLTKYAKLVTIDGDEVILEIDGKEVRTKAFNIKFAKRKEKKKEVKKRPKNIPPNKFGFELVEDNYMLEIYQGKSNYHGIPVTIQVRMRYGTTVRTWYVRYSIHYGGYYTELGDGGRSGIESRKEARRIAHEYISNSSMKDLDDLSDFYKESIRKEGKVK